MVDKKIIILVILSIIILGLIGFFAFKYINGSMQNDVQNLSKSDFNVTDQGIVDTASKSDFNVTDQGMVDTTSKSRYLED